MLVSFSVRNFRSFGEEVTLNMVASNKLTDHPQHRVEIDKSAVLYGAYAAGKSNLVKAMGFAQDTTMKCFGLPSQFVWRHVKFSTKNSNCDRN